MSIARNSAMLCFEQKTTKVTKRSWCFYYQRPCFASTSYAWRGKNSARLAVPSEALAKEGDLL